MSNESIVAVPGNVEDAGQTKVFLERLVVELDKVLGFRKDPLSKPTTNFQGRQISRLTTTGSLDERVTKLTTRLIAVETSNKDTENRLAAAEAAIATIKQGTAITLLGYTVVTASATYVQAEAQQVADDVKTVADKLDSVITVLKASEILT